MPRWTNHVPKLRHHKATGRAVVTLDGRHVYLGRYGTPEADAEYRRVIAEYLTLGEVRTPGRVNAAEPTVADVILTYWRHCEQTLSRKTREGSVRPALRRLGRMYGTVPVRDFDPPALRAFQRSLLEEPGREGRTLSRTYVNVLVGRVRAMFKWGVAEGLVPAPIWQGLQAVPAVRLGAPGVAETERVRPVDDAVVTATLAQLPAVVADIVRLQRLTGMRPGEVCRLRATEIDMDAEVWVHRPARHKNSHRGQGREVALGPRAQALLGPYLRRRPLGAALFSPREGERVAPQYRDHYDTVTYGQAIRRAASRAGVESWSPNQLRHARATELRREFGVDAAGAVLGHARVETTQIYAEKSLAMACSIAAKTG